MKNGGKGSSSCTKNEDNLDDMKLSMVSANAKYQNYAKKLSAMQKSIISKRQMC